jgi:hypothetical protein
MQQRLLLLKLSCIVFVVSTCVGQSTMTKQDFSEHGFSIVLPNDPGFESELKHLGFSTSVGAQRLRPFSVIVRNTSHRMIVAFGIRWTKRHVQSGNVATSDGIYVQRFGLLDGGHPRYDGPLEGIIQPEGSRFVTVVGMIQKASELENLDPSLPDLSQWVFEKVQLDSVVFDDGDAFGADQLGAVKRLEAQVDAQQDLMQELSDRLARGEHFEEVLRNLQGAESSKPDPSSQPNASPKDVYTLTRQQYLQELSVTEKNFGEDAARRRLRQLKYTTKPTIRLSASGGK